MFALACTNLLSSPSLNAWLVRLISVSLSLSSEVQSVSQEPNSLIERLLLFVLEIAETLGKTKVFRHRDYDNEAVLLLLQKRRGDVDGSYSTRTNLSPYETD